MYKLYLPSFPSKAISRDFELQTYTLTLQQRFDLHTRWSNVLRRALNVMFHKEKNASPSSEMEFHYVHPSKHLDFVLQLWFYKCSKLVKPLNPLFFANHHIIHFLIDNVRLYQVKMFMFYNVQATNLTSVGKIWNLIVIILCNTT